jgi:hypothetical protein
VGVIGFIEGAGPLDDNLDELQAGMAEALDENIALDAKSTGKADAANQNAAELPQEPQSEQKLAADPASSEDASNAEPTRRLTPHSQSRHTTLEAVEELNRVAQDHLQQIEGRLTEITTSQQLTSRFFTILRADIDRANDLELANAGLVAGQRKLVDQVSDLTRKLQERDIAIEGLRRGEASLTKDNEQLRSTLSALKVELDCATTDCARNEASLGEAVTIVASQTVEAERHARENEVLREKQVNLQIDLSKVLKREADAQRKVEEMSAIHATEIAQHAELVAALGKSEKEMSRLQLVAESAQRKEAEMAEAAVIAAAEREAEVERMQADIGGLRAAIEGLQARLDATTNEHGEAVSQITSLKGQLKDTISDKQVVDEKLATLMKEYDHERLNLSTATANISQLTLQRETDQIKLDIHRQECDELRAEVAVLSKRILGLLPFERLYKASKAGQTNGFSVDAADVDELPGSAPWKH